MEKKYDSLLYLSVPSHFKNTLMLFLLLVCLSLQLVTGIRTNGIVSTKHG